MRDHKKPSSYTRRPVDVSVYKSSKMNKYSMSMGNLHRFPSVTSPQSSVMVTSTGSINNSMSVFAVKQYHKDLAAKAAIITNRINKLGAEEKML